MFDQAAVYTVSMVVDDRVAEITVEHPVVSVGPLDPVEYPAGRLAAETGVPVAELPGLRLVWTELGFRRAGVGRVG